MFDERLVLVGAAINVFGSVGYIISTLKGKTKPNKVTWLLWVAAPLIAFSAQIKQGVGLPALPTFMNGFLPALIFLASFVNKKAQWKIGKLDMTCGTLSICGLVLWQATQVPNIAILFAILADGLAAIPTLVKSYFYPETENDIAFSVAVISAGTALLTINKWDFAHFGFPLYLILMSGTIFLLIRFKIGLKLQKFSKF